MKLASKAFLVLLCSAIAASALGQAPAPASASAPATFQSDFASDVDFVGKRLLDLANAVPADKYGWRPAPGVRSVGEVYMHVASADFALPGLVGGKLPEGFSRDLEKTVTDKAKIVEWLKKGIENAKAVGSGLSAADLDKKIKVQFLGGAEMSQRRILMIVQTHMHEHLGQSIAYARSVGVTPPWSEASEQPAPPKK
jgi:uncharacterized damage-inducible protein DinB